MPSNMTLICFLSSNIIYIGQKWPGQFPGIPGNAGNRGEDGKFHKIHQILNQIKGNIDK